MPCAGCVKKSILCEYPGSPPGGGAKDSGAASVSSVDNAMGVDEHRGEGEGVDVDTDISTLIDDFFRHIYPLPSYSFLHPAKTRRKFAAGTLDRTLVIALAAVSSLRCPNRPRSESAQDREAAWISEAEALIWEHLESPSIARLQATLLVVLYRVETAQLRRAFMLAALAGRAAAAMRLNHERPAPAHGTLSSAPVVKSLEVRRRLMWSLKMVERYFSVGLPEFELCPVENIYIQLPCAEYLFGGDDPDDSQETDDGGAYHVVVNLEMFRRDVMKLHRSLALYEQPFPQLPRLIQDFQQHLDRIGTQFPPTEEDSDGKSHVRRGRWLPRYLHMKLSWHQCHCDLYRLLLRNFRDAAPRVVIDALDTEFLNAAEVSCMRHAQAIVQTIAALTEDEHQTHGEPRLLEFDTAICSYTASRILLFTARFGLTQSRPSEDFALSRAETCLAAVRHFFARSLLVKTIVGELTRLIEVFSAGTVSSPGRFSSPRLAATALPGARRDEEEGRHRDPATQLSGAARIRQRLAIHSLLRQADFSDDDDDDEQENEGGGIQQPTSTAISYMSPSTATTSSPGANSQAATGMQGLPAYEQMGSPYQTQQFTSAPQHHHQQTTTAMSEASPTTQYSATLLQQGNGNPDPSWPHRLYAGGDLLQTGTGTSMEGIQAPDDDEDGDDEGMHDAPGGALNQRSFSFPWLQREETEMSWSAA